MPGDLYLIDDERGWFVVRECEHWDSSGIDGTFVSRLSAVIAGKDMAGRLGARFSDGEARHVLAFPPTEIGRAPL